MSKSMKAICNSSLNSVKPIKSSCVAFSLIVSSVVVGYDLG